MNNRVVVLKARKPYVCRLYGICVPFMTKK